MEVARLAGEPEAMGGQHPSILAPLWVKATCAGEQGPAPPGPPVTRASGRVCEPEGLASCRMRPIPETTLRPLCSRKAAKRPHTSDPMTPPPPLLLPASLDPSGAGGREEEPGPRGERVGERGAPGAPAGGEAGGGCSRGPRAAERAAGGRCRWGPRAPSGGGRRARPSPGRDRGGARDLPAGGGAGHPAWPPPKFPGAAAAALPSQAPGVGPTRGQPGPLCSQTPRLHCVPVGFPTWEAPRACARAPSPASASASHLRAGCGPSGRRSPHPARCPGSRRAAPPGPPPAARPGRPRPGAS